MVQTFLPIFIALIVLVGLGYIGFIVVPRPFRPHPAPAQPGAPRPFRDGLPEPVEKHFLDTLGATPPEMQSAVVWGRGKISIRGVWLPLRFKAWYRAGEAYARRFEITWFQRPVLRGRDALVHGEGLVEIGDNLETGARTDLGQTLELWAGMLWLPAVFVHDPRAAWEAVDAHCARLHVPFGAKKETLEAHFDPLSGRMTDLTGMHYADPNEDQDEGEEAGKEPWRVDLLGWKRINDLLVPSQVDIAWGESGSPWVYWDVDGIVYNVNVSDQLA